MAYDVIFKKAFNNRISNLLEYLEKEWNKEVADDFLKKLDNRISTLRLYPFIGSPSRTVKDVRGILITKHNKLFYRVSGNKILLLTLVDTRQNPKKNRY